MIESLKIRHLQAFLAVIEHDTTIKSSEFLGMSQPSVSNAIKSIETIIARPLFERTTNRIKPNANAIILAKRINLAFNHLLNAEIDFKSRHQNIKSLNLLNRISEFQMRAYDVFFQVKNYSKAAAILNSSQPNIHRAIKQLHTSFHNRLFQRDGMRFIFTQDGELIARAIGLYFKEIALAFEELDEANGIYSGTINVGALPLARSKWLPNIIAQLLEKYPEINIKILDGPYEEQLEALLSGRIDYIFGALRQKQPHPMVEQFELFQDPLVIVMRSSHEYAKNFNTLTDKLSNLQLSQIGWILPRNNTPARQEFDKFMLSKGLKPPIRFIECSSLIATRELLNRTNYAALLSARQIEPELKTGELKIMGPPLTNTSRAIGIAMRKGFTPSNLAGEFINMSKSIVKFL